MSGESREEARRLLEEEEEHEAHEAGGSGGSDVEEVRMVLDAISSFLKDLSGPLKDLFNTLLQALDGAKIGEDVASFYRKLKEAGMPDDMVQDLTEKYFKSRLEAANILGLLAKALKREITEEDEEEEED